VVRAFLKDVVQRSLALVVFVTLAFMASVENKPSDKRKQDLSSSFSISQQREQANLSLNPLQLFDNIVCSVKDAFNDPALIEYAKEQGAEIPDSPAASDQHASDKQASIDFGNKRARTR
jgi:hypothetical protein